MSNLFTIQQWQALHNVGISAYNKAILDDIQLARRIDIEYAVTAAVGAAVRETLKITGVEV